MPSSVIASSHYNDTTSTLTIVFVSGTVYDYKDVPRKVYDAFKKAVSKGIYFNKHIKEVYSFEKISGN